MTSVVYFKDPASQSAPSSLFYALEKEQPGVNYRQVRGPRYHMYPGEPEFPKWINNLATSPGYFCHIFFLPMLKISIDKLNLETWA